ncbi:hypothetical protein BSZ39_06845 [Bowdeniella nasicola]|uniref:Uncharacterized protein n=1 Tax=Bowdeniella nasicola TaxID=208480 RepID=A0A1Q5Q206_9ACTO|nr:hypothetical protein BSZ39_06845 [Bowdeniella nasicola]
MVDRSAFRKSYMTSEIMMEIADFSLQSTPLRTLWPDGIATSITHLRRVAKIVFPVFQGKTAS